MTPPTQRVSTPSLGISCVTYEAEFDCKGGKMKDSRNIDIKLSKSELCDLHMGIEQVIEDLGRHIETEKLPDVARILSERIDGLVALRQRLAGIKAEKGIQ